MEKEYISSVSLIKLKTILDEMIYQKRLTETEMERILNKAGLKKKGKVWVDELDSVYSNL